MGRKRVKRKRRGAKPRKQFPKAARGISQRGHALQRLFLAEAMAKAKAAQAALVVSWSPAGPGKCSDCGDIHEHRVNGRLPPDLVHLASAEEIGELCSGCASEVEDLARQARAVREAKEGKRAENP